MTSNQPDQPTTGPIPFVPRLATDHHSAERHTDGNAHLVFLPAFHEQGSREHHPVTPPALVFRVTGWLLVAAVVLVALAAPEGIGWRIAVAAALLTYGAARAVHAWRAAGAVLDRARSIAAPGR